LKDQLLGGDQSTDETLRCRVRKNQV